MNQNRPSIDGFVPRRRVSSEQSQGVSGLQPSQEATRGLVRPGSSAEGEARHSALKPEEHHALTRADIDQSFEGINDEEKHTKQKRRKQLNKKKLIKRIVIALVALFIIITAYIGIKFLIASGNIFKGDLLGLVQSAPLKMDANGRSNVLVFGTSEDSEAHKANGGQGAPYLTDSMMVISIDQNKKDAYMISIPRDMYVEFDGQACTSGYSGRINEVYQCFSNFGKNETAGTEALQKKAGEVLGLDIQYATQVNYTVVKDIVDAVGGISVVIDSADPRGVFDPNFDWMCGRECNMVKYPNGPTGNIDGEHALALARARDAQGAGYGFARGNFDREQYQQKIIKAIREKAVSAGTLTNVGKVTSLIDALGDNLRTDFETKEIRTLMALGNDIPSDQIVSINLDEADPVVYNFTNVGGGSMITPTSGDFNYTSISNYIKQQISSDPVVREQAKIGIYNGSGVPGVAATVAEALQQKGLTVADGAVGNAPAGTYEAYEIYDMSQQKNATKTRLEELYGTTAKTTPPPVNVIGLDFVIVVGKAPAETSQ